MDENENGNGKLTTDADAAAQYANTPLIGNNKLNQRNRIEPNRTEPNRTEPN